MLRVLGRAQVFQDCSVSELLFEQEFHPGVPWESFCASHTAEPNEAELGAIVASLEASLNI